MSKAIIDMLNNILKNMQYGSITLTVQKGRICLIQASETYKV